MLRIAVRTKKGQPPVEFELSGDRITIGRRQDNDFRIKDTYVSAYHAELTRLSEGEFEIVDQESFNGTFINGVRVEKGTIKAGDSIKLGTLPGRVLGDGESWDGTVDKGKPRSPNVVPLRDRKDSKGSDTLPVKKPRSVDFEPDGLKTQKIVPGITDGDTKKTGPSKVPAPTGPVPGPLSFDDAEKLENRVSELEEERKTLQKELKEAREKEAGESESEAEIGRLKQEAKQASDELAASKKEISSLEADLKDSKQSAGEEAEKEVATLKREIENLKADRDETEEVEDLRGQLEDAKKEKERADVVLGATKEKLTEIESIHSETREQLSATKEKLGGLNADLEFQRKKAEDLEAFAEVAEGGAEELKAAKVKIESLNLQLEEITKKHETEVLELKAGLEETGAKGNSEAQALRLELESARSLAAESRNTVEGELASAREEIEELKKAADEAAGKSESQLTSAKAEIEELKRVSDESRGSVESELIRARAEIDGLKNAVDESRAAGESQLAASRAEFEELRNAADENKAILESELAAAKTKIEELGTDLAEAKQKSDSRGVELAALAANLTASSSDLDLLRENSQQELAAAREEIDGLKGAAEEFKSDAISQLESAKTELDILSAKLADSEKEAEAVRSELSEAKVKIGGDEARITELKSEKEQLIDGIGDFEELTRKLEKKREKLSSVTSELAAATEESERVNREKSEAEAILEKVRGDLKASTASLEETESKGRAAEAEVSRIAAEESSLGDKVAMLAVEIADREKQKEKLDGAAQQLVEAEEKFAEAKKLKAETDSRIEEARDAEERLEEMRLGVIDFEGKYEEGQRKLDRKLRELKLAEDRIELAEILEADILSRTEELTNLNGKLELASNTVNHLLNEREDLSQSIRELKSELGGAQSSHRSNGSSEKDEARRTQLQEEIKEYEEYQRILRESIRPEAATVQVLSRQLIKKIDLIDDLVARFSKSQGNEGASQQLSVLRESFLDFLRENSVESFSFAPGTELEMDLRQRIKIVETRKGDGEGTKIVETVRPGYTCQDDDEGELILRKAEVITHG